MSTFKENSIQEAIKIDALHGGFPLGIIGPLVDRVEAIAAERGLMFNYVDSREDGDTVDIEPVVFSSGLTYEDISITGYSEGVINKLATATVDYIASEKGDKAHIYTIGIAYNHRNPSSPLVPYIMIEVRFVNKQDDVQEEPISDGLYERTVKRAEQFNSILSRYNILPDDVEVMGKVAKTIEEIAGWENIDLNVVPDGYYPNIEDVSKYLETSKATRTQLLSETEQDEAIKVMAYEILETIKKRNPNNILSLDSITVSYDKRVDTESKSNKVHILTNLIKL